MADQERSRIQGKRSGRIVAGGKAAMRSKIIEEKRAQRLLQADFNLRQFVDDLTLHFYSSGETPFCTCGIPKKFHPFVKSIASIMHYNIVGLSSSKDAIVQFYFDSEHEMPDEDALLRAKEISDNLYKSASGTHVVEELDKLKLQHKASKMRSVKKNLEGGKHAALDEHFLSSKPFKSERKSKYLDSSKTIEFIDSSGFNVQRMDPSGSETSESEYIETPSTEESDQYVEDLLSPSPSSASPDIPHIDNTEVNSVSKPELSSSAAVESEKSNVVDSSVRPKNYINPNTDWIPPGSSKLSSLFKNFNISSSND